MLGSDASRPKQIITAYRDYLNGQDDEGQAIRMTNLEQASPLSIPLYPVIMFFWDSKPLYLAVCSVFLCSD